MKISVITPTLPTRDTLPDAVRSVAAQTLVPYEHLIGVDYWTRGPSIIRNTLARAAGGDWLAFLDDDDILYPHHLETLARTAADSDADVVWSLHDGHHLEHCCYAPKVLRENHIPVTTLVRADLFGTVGGFPITVGGEDALLWRKLVHVGARFQCVHEITWTYRPSGSPTGHWAHR